jgi:TP901 family phage tail tape measure protein
MASSKIFTKVVLDGSEFIKTTQEMKKQMDAFAAKAAQVSKSVKGISPTAWLKLGGKLGGVGLAVGGVGKAFADTTKTNIAFEHSLSVLAAVLGTTVKDIKDLEAEAKRLGATTAYTAAEVVALETELSKLGFTKKEILDSTEAVLKFSMATGAGLAEAAKLAGGTLRSFGADASEMGRYVSAMAIATTKSALNFEYLDTAISTVGPVAKSFNFEIEEVIALLGVLADNNFEASTAATGLRNIILYLADASGKLSKRLGAPVRSAADLSKGLKKLQDEGVNLSEALELTDKRAVALFAALMNNPEKIDALAKSITGVEGDLSKMADTMADNVHGALAGLSSAWEALGFKMIWTNKIIKATIDKLAELLRYLAREDPGAVGRETERFAKNAAARWEENGIAKRETERMQADVSAKVAGGMTEKEAVAAVVTPKRDYWENSLNEQTARLEELRKEAEEINAKRAAAAKELVGTQGTAAVSGIPENSPLKGLIEQWTEVTKKIKAATEAEALYKVMLTEIDSVFPQSKEAAATQTETPTGPAANSIEGKEAALKDAKEKRDKSVNKAERERLNKLIERLEYEIRVMKGEAPADGSIAALQERLSKLQEERQNATSDGERKRLDGEIKQVSDDIQAMQPIPPDGSIAALQGKLSKLQEERQNVTTDGERKRLDGEIKQVSDDIQAMQPAPPDGSIAALQERLSKLKAKLSGATNQTERNTLDEQIRAAQKQIEAMTPTDAKAGSMAFAEGKVEKLRYELSIETSPEGRERLMKEIKKVEKELAAMTPPTGMEIWGGIGDAIGSIDGVAGAFGRLKTAIDEDASAWEKFMAGFGFLQQVVGMVKSLTDMTNMLTIATEAGTTAKEVEAGVDKLEEGDELAGVAKEVSGALEVAGAKETEAVASAGAAAAGAASSQASIPIAGPILAIAAIAAIIGALSGLVKFAGGGIADGVVGGNSPVGDRLLARINSGEMVLNKQQQGNLLGILTGKSVGANISAAEQKSLFGMIGAGLPKVGGISAFASGGIIGASFPSFPICNYNIPAVYVPEHTGSSAALSPTILSGGDREVYVSGEFKVKGDDLVAALKHRERRLNNA